MHAWFRFCTEPGMAPVFSKWTRAAGAVLALGCAAASAQAQDGKWIPGKHAEREYKLYVPAKQGDRPAPLVVMLHGCTQNPDVFAESTRMNAHADKGGFLVLYPAQKLSANPARCWNWFLPKNQARDSGEPAEIVGLVQQVAGEYPVDRKRVYVAGLSAGASMSAILAACYPDVFAAAAIHDGTMYKSATSFGEAQKVMVTGKAPDPDRLASEAWSCGGKKSLAVPVMVWHGEGDNIVNRANGEFLVRQFVALNDLADDGKSNGSVKQAAKTESGRVEKGHDYSVVSYELRGRPLVQYYKVDKMGHAWSGGKDDLIFSDGKGPDASGLMWNFFRQFSR
jgi:poly(hydroxyalkanoate) depolymerase family esterase